MTNSKTSLKEQVLTYIKNVENERDAYRDALILIAEPYWEMSHDKIKNQRDDYKKIAKKVLDEYWTIDNEKEETKQMDDNF